MFCPNCGAENDEDAQFCGNCGAPLNGAQDDKNVNDFDAQDVVSTGMHKQNGKAMFCPNCGAKIEKYSLFCENCGELLSESKKSIPDGINDKPDEELSGTDKEGFFHSGVGHVVIGFIATCAVIGLVIGIYSFSRSGSEPEETTEAEAQETDETVEIVESNESAELEEPGGSDEFLQDGSEVGTDSGAQVQVEIETQDIGTTDENEDYLVPDADSRYYSTAELSGLSKDQLRIARNEIYARHGRLFDSDDLQEYFNSKSWYNGTIQPNDFDESVFNQYEKANIDTIKSLE